MFGQRGIVGGACGAVALTLIGALPALAEEGELMRDTLSTIGLIEPRKPVIQYRDRAPLAMPPKAVRGAPAAAVGGGGGLAAGLPVPQTRQADPSWPKDPEILRQERAAVEARKPISRGAQGRVSDNNETLSVYEMDKGYKAGASVTDSPAYRPGDGTRESTWLNPLELMRGGGSTAAAAPTVEPRRGSLAEPPTGYRSAPVQVVAPRGEPIGGPINDRDEADPRSYLRSQSR